MKTELLRANHPVAYRYAQDILQHGGLVSFPTDTVYGLAVALLDESALESLTIIKGRDNVGVIGVLVAAQEDLKSVIASMPAAMVRLANRFWPGSLTLMLPARPGLPAVLAPGGRVAVRIPANPVALGLLRQTGPLAVTAANLSDTPNPLSAQDVLNGLQGRVHLIIDGGVVKEKLPSTIVDCSGTEVALLREGPISWNAILTVLAA